MKKLLLGLGLVFGLSTICNADWECQKEKITKILADSEKSVYLFPNSAGWHGIKFDIYTSNAWQPVGTYDICWAKIGNYLSSLDWTCHVEDEGIPADSKWEFFEAGSDDIAFKINFKTVDKYSMPIYEYSHQHWKSVEIRYQLCQNGMD